MTTEKRAIPLCPICSRQDIVFVSEHNDFPGTGIWFCSLCNHWFGYPGPDGLEIDRYYKETYGSRRRRYFGEEYYVLMERRAKAQIRFIEVCLSRVGMPGNLHGWRIIDWGCGIGALVAALQHRGADVVGYDSDLDAIEVGWKRWTANINCSSAFDFSAFSSQFDMLTLSHVIEHLPDIQQTLKHLYKVIQPGGYVFIEVPNCFGEMFLPEMDHESHLHFFSRQSLTLLVEGLGLQVLACVSCGPPKQPAYSQKQTSATSNLAMRMVRRIEFLLKHVARRLGVNTKQVKTIYDGFYEHYPPDDSGRWLRCLARI